MAIQPDSSQTQPRRRAPLVLRVFRLWQARGIRFVLSRLAVWVRGTRRYNPNWVKAYDSLSASDVTLIGDSIARFARRPLVSVVLLTGEALDAEARATAESVLAQLYGEWELLIVTAENEKSVAEFAARDSRILCLTRDDKQPQAFAANAALATARGEFIAFLDHRDRLAPTALYLAVESLNRHSEAALVYGDEDQVDSDGTRSDPNFKTDWNPDLLLSQNYFGSFVVYRRSDVDKIGGFRGEYAGGERYDLNLRMVERIPSTAILHVPYLLNHRLAAAGDDIMPGDAGARALRDHLARSGIDAEVGPSRSGRYYRVRRRPAADMPRVSLIMPTRDRLSLLRGAVDSIIAKTKYANYEIVVVDNRSEEPATLAYFASLANEPRVRVLKYDGEFNYSAINNFAAGHCTSPILGLVNNDILVIDAEWLTEMVSHAVRPEVGAVGAMLYYPDDSIQHAGIIVGIGDSAVNCYGGLPRGTGGYFGRAEVIQNYSAVTGACMLTRAEVFAEVGGLNDIDLAVAFNDVDFCLRVRARGYLVTWTPYAELYHLESASRGDDFTFDKTKRFERERRYLSRRWPGIMKNDPFYNPNLSLYAGLFRLAEAPRLRRPWLS